jgi:hypothetical protein
MFTFLVFFVHSRGSRTDCEAKFELALALSHRCGSSRLITRLGGGQQHVQEAKFIEQAGAGGGGMDTVTPPVVVIKHRG